MKKVLTAACAAMALAACGALPAPMAASEASALLARFAAGESDVCTREGRDNLRRAVRAYGRVMEENGVVWPQFNPDAQRPEGRSALDLAVLTAFSAGFVDRGDLVAAAQRTAEDVARDHLGEVTQLRGAERQACAEVAALQHKAVRYMAAVERQEALRVYAERGGASYDLARVHYDAVRRSHVEMQMALHAVRARLGAPAH